MERFFLYLLNTGKTLWWKRCELWYLTASRGKQNVNTQKTNTQIANRSIFRFFFPWACKKRKKTQFKNEAILCEMSQTCGLIKHLHLLCVHTHWIVRLECRRAFYENGLIDYRISFIIHSWVLMKVFLFLRYGKLNQSPLRYAVEWSRRFSIFA